MKPDDEVKIFTILIEENDHPLYGLGRIAYHYSGVNKSLEIFIDYDPSTVNQPIKILVGDNAINVFNKFRKKQEPTIGITEELLITAACAATGKFYHELTQRGREEYCVLGRNLIFWASVKYLKYSTGRAGLVFGYKHSTASRAYKLIENGILAYWQKEVKSKFVNEILKYANSISNNPDRKEEIQM